MDNLCVMDDLVLETFIVFYSDEPEAAFLLMILDAGCSCKYVFTLKLAC